MVHIVSSFDLSRSDRCLDFANRWWQDAAGDYADLLKWSVEAGYLSQASARELNIEAERRPDETTAVLASARDLAGSMRGVFRDVAAGHDPDPQNIERLNRALADALPKLRLLRGDRCCTWTWSGPDDALDRPLWSVILSAANLLTSDNLDRLRECASDTCSWLFFDHSKNRKRKWCDMGTCGNRAKAKRFYKKRQGGR